jgi:hypothetical protein
MQAPDPYRSVHVPRPTQHHTSAIGSPWLLLSEREVAAWRLRAHATCTDRAARCLAWLEQEFAR